LLLPAPEGSGQGKFKGGGKGGPPAKVVVPPTPSIHPAPVVIKPVQPVVVKPVQPVVKIPSQPVVVKPAKPVVVHEPKVIVTPPAKVLPGSGKVVVTKPVIHEPINKWSNFPKHPVVVTPPKHVGVVKFTPEYRKTFAAAVVKRPLIVNGKNMNLVSVKHYEPHGVLVRNHFRPIQHSWFTANWWNTHHITQFPRWHYYNIWNRHPWWWWWRPVTWPVFINWMPYTWGQPFYYDYGTNVIVQNNQVFVNDVPVGTPEDYAQQAFEIADSPPPEQDPDWMPLGTFALSSSQEDADPNLVVQLAVTKDGFVSGTEYNRETDTTVALEGKVDPNTQRVAIKPADNPDLVLETGIYNLTQPQTPVLMHFGLTNTQTWYLVRLDAPPEGAMPDGPVPNG
jgi:hypothetical protein